MYEFKLFLAGGYVLVAFIALCINLFRDSGANMTWVWIVNSIIYCILYTLLIVKYSS